MHVRYAEFDFAPAGTVVICAVHALYTAPAGTVVLCGVHTLCRVPCGLHTQPLHQMAQWLYAQYMHVTLHQLAQWLCAVHARYAEFHVVYMHNLLHQLAQPVHALYTCCEVH
jgi:hypothetical protein